ncbi:MAG: glucose-6-phosphate isomerase [Desulfovibrionaceae bacterium]|nr:glucose-6-phosphate isomerase [Desulfovibrionaceae bacterium]
MSNLTLDWSYAWPSTAGPADRAGAPDAAEAAQPHAARLEQSLSELPFLSLPFAEELSAQLDSQAEFLRGFRHLLVLGIGGSALGARALQKAFFPAQDRPCHSGPWLWIADNVEPVAFAALLDTLPPDETLVVVVSKSGGTIETVSQYLLTLPWLQKHLPDTWREHLLVVTDTRIGFLREQVGRYGLRSLPVPEGLGGRYSVLSAVGLVPAAFLGMDWKALLRGACDVGRPLAAHPASLSGHPAWKLARWAFHLATHAKNQLIFFCYIPAWATFGPWFAQLWAESLGKNGQGTMPLPAVGVTDQHSLLQMFLDGPLDKGCLFLSAPTPRGPVLGSQDKPWDWLSGKSMGDILEAETLATRMSLAQRGVPLVHVAAPDCGEYAAGKLIMLLEASTIFTGWLMGINPVDQPAVEEGKKLARARLGAPGSGADAERLARFTEREAQADTTLV